MKDPEEIHIRHTHKKLVEIAYRWVLKNASCGVAFKELYSGAVNGEYPDVIGFGGWGHSVVIEVKVSRADFLSDKKKPFRKEPQTGMGTRRYYCCPSGMIKKEELPDGWGLIWVNENGKATTQHRPMVIETNEAGHSYNADFKHEKNLLAEHGLMYSVLRRLFIKGFVKHIYDKQYNRATANELILLNNQQIELL